MTEPPAAGGRQRALSMICGGSAKPSGRTTTTSMPRIAAMCTMAARHGQRQRLRVIDPAQHEFCAARYLELVQRAPIGQRLAGMIHGRFHVDQRLVAQLVDQSEQSLVQIVFEILALGKGAHAQRVAVRRQHRDALANVLGGGAVHDGIAAGSPAATFPVPA